jgi:phosphohistidine phosphatase
MRRLLLLRHAKAEKSEPGTKDFARVLIDRGRKDAAKIGAYMATHALVPDRVILSPAARTQETWKYAAAAFHPAPAAMSVEKVYDATPHTILAVIKDAPASAHTLMVIGHNPGLYELALMLIASGDVDARERLREKLPTSGLLIIDFAFDNWNKLHPQSGRLERFISPKSLETAAN